jgi:ribonuclease HI
VSDSKYSICAISEWYDSWIKDPIKLEGKMNLDLIGPAKQQLDEIIKKIMPFTFQHVKSHQPEPRDCESIEWFYWKCNDIVDNLCSTVLH